ncbi:MAG TPA: hypothetical protein VF862_01825 [Gemmatimonadales bacterium]
MGLYRALELTLPGMLLAILLMVELGRRAGIRHRQRTGEPAAGVGAIEGAVFGLLGLILAFTFSGAAARYDSRRDMVTEEANDIGTAWFRVDLVPEAQQPALRQAFRDYLDHRIAAYQAMPDTTAMLREIKKSEALQAEIWRQAVAATSDPALAASKMLLLPALNAMIDITTTRTMAARSHMPEFIYLLLVVLALVGGLVGGYAMSVSPKRSLVHSIGFALVLSLTIYVILDLEFPRKGLIRLDAYDQVLIDLRASMD